MKIIIKDDTIGGETKNSFKIETKKESATVKQLIRMRIFHEVEMYNKNSPMNLDRLYGQLRLK